MFKIMDIFEPKNKETLIVAEIGINHCGDFGKLIELIKVSKYAGASAVKFQVFSEDGFYINSKYLPDKIVRKIPVDIFRKCYIPFDRYREAFEYARSIDILPFATPLDLESFHFLDDMGVELYKIASSDITYLPLLRLIAKTKKVTIVSTGFTTPKDIKNHIKILDKNPLVIMYCVSKYPSNPSDFSLSEFYQMRKNFEYIPKINKHSKTPRVVGFSDHSKTLSIPVAFVSLGARVIEKHITLDENDDSPDNLVSIGPEKFRQMVCMIREVEASLFSKKKVLPDKLSSILSRRSFVLNREIRENEMIKEEYLDAKRPGIFIASNTKNWKKLLNSRAKKDILKGAPIKRSDLKLLK